ncbi:hypothetical protein [Enterococcus sp. LJL90]
MKYKNFVLFILFIAVIIVASIFIFLGINETPENTQIVGGYGSHLRYLDCTVSEIVTDKVVVIANENAYTPETFKSGDKIILDFKDMQNPINPLELGLSIGDQIKLTYLTIDDVNYNPPLVFMGYPSNIELDGAKLIYD